MVFDSMENFTSYLCLHPHFNDVYDFIKGNNMPDMEEGRYKVNGHGTYALVKEYFTKDISETFIECHRKFIDIQILLKGTERIGICSKSECKEYAYDKENDLQKLEGKLNFIKINRKSFAIFFPCDGHMPELKYGDLEEKVKKIVFKVPILS